MAACPLPITVVDLTNCEATGSPTSAGRGASISACYLVAEWLLELDMRWELVPFGLYVGSSCLTDSHINSWHCNGVASYSRVYASTRSGISTVAGPSISVF